MRTHLSAKSKYRTSRFLLQSCFALLIVSSAVSSPFAKTRSDEGQTLTVRVEVSPSDVIQAVEQVAQDQIIHGTYSYEKERILYGAHSASAAHVFGTWPGPGKAYYKVANNVLSPRFFKDSADIGTISVRYVVQEAGPNAATVQIDAMFVDARNVKHPSLGGVESSEYAAIEQHLKTIQANRKEIEGASAQVSDKLVRPSVPPPAAANPAELANDHSASGLTVPQLQKRIDALRHQVELRIRDQGAQLKAAPFHSAATLQSVPAQAEVLIVIVSPYWYGVETDDGHRGWIHHSQLEPLP